jgi:hypothetical protein
LDPTRVGKPPTGAEYGPAISVNEGMIKGAKFSRSGGLSGAPGGFRPGARASAPLVVVTP